MCHETPFSGRGSRNAAEDPRPNMLQLTTLVRFFINANVSGSKAETIVQCSACHSISVFTFYLLYHRKCILTRLYFQTYFYRKIFEFEKSIFTD